MANYRDQASIFQTFLGNITRRPTATIAADQDLFSIDGGRCLIIGLVGQVTTAIGAGSQDIGLVFDPDDGGTDVVVADTSTPLAIDSDEVGTMYTLNSSFGGDFVATLDYAERVHLPPASQMLFPEGDLRLDVTGTEAGSIQWECVWVAWDVGAAVTAV